MIVYTLLFTLLHKNPKENKYIYMFYIWLTYLLRNGGLEQEDTLCILCDDATLEQLNSNEILCNLMEKCKSKFEIHTIEQPKNISRGICERYKFKKENEFILYLDLDILVKGNIKEYFLRLPNEKEYIIAAPEGKLIDKDYAGNLLEDKIITEKEIIENHTGYTAGLYGYRWGEKVEKIMETIIKSCLEKELEPLYTIDQPFYNREIYLAKSNTKESKLRIYFIDDNAIENNPDLQEPDKKGIFVNYCGEPGKGSVHFNKMILHLCFSYLS